MKTKTDNAKRETPLAPTQKDARGQMEPTPRPMEDLAVALSLARGNLPALGNGARLKKIAIHVERAMRAVNSFDDLLEACKFFMGALDDGDFVRDTSHDHDSGWALKAAKLVRDLKKVQNAISKAEGREAPSDRVP